MLNRLLYIALGITFGFVLSRAGVEWPDEISITVLGAAILVTVVISGVDYVLSWSARARAGE